MQKKLNYKFKYKIMIFWHAYGEIVWSAFAVAVGIILWNASTPAWFILAYAYIQWRAQRTVIITHSNKILDHQETILSLIKLFEQHQETWLSLAKSTEEAQKQIEKIIEDLNSHPYMKIVATSPGSNLEKTLGFTKDNPLDNPPNPPQAEGLEATHGKSKTS